VFNVEKVTGGVAPVRGIVMAGVGQFSTHTRDVAVAPRQGGIGICDEDGMFVSVSRSLARLLEHPVEEVIGRPFLSFVHANERAAALAAYFEAVVAVAAGVSGGGRELRCVTGSGAVIPVLVEWALAGPDEFGKQRGVLHVTDRRGQSRRRNLIGKSRLWAVGASPDPGEPHRDCVAARRLDAFLATSDEIVWELDPTGFITFISPAVQRHLGYGPIEQSWQTILPSSQQLRGQLLLHDGATPGAAWRDEEYVFTTKSGQLRSLWSSGQPQANGSGTVTGFAGTLRPLHTDDRAGRDERLRGQIRELLDRRLIRAVFQPVVDLRRGAPVAIEAFSRFPAGVGRTPAQLFTDAAALGLATELEMAAIETALVAARALPEHLCVSINISPPSLIAGRLRSLLTDTGWDPARIILELTEHIPVSEYAPIAAALNEIRRDGCRLAIDDAGSGYASFKHILALSPELIKLDRFLITDLDTDPARRALIKAVVSFAGEVGADISAEGIDTAAQATILQDLGVHYGQGFHLGRPLPITAILTPQPQTTPDE
jgi:EAL domain-containing protein (putative c-di-GMP-specific phosphodiesterase class I)/PAS domain-containing protein